MHIWIYLFIMIVIGQLNTVLSKKFQLNFVMDSFHFIVYNLINAFFGSICFFILSGFSIDMNLKTFLFSLGFSALVGVSLIFSVFLYSKVTVSLASILSNSGNVITSAMFGILVLSEKLSFSLILALGLMLLAIILPLFNAEKVKGTKKTHLVICVIQFFLAGATTIYSKLFAGASGVTDANSYFFMTNFIIVMVCFIITLIYSIYTKRSPFKAFGVGQIVNICSRTVISNVSSLLSILIIAVLPVSIYTVITSSCGLVGSALLSRFYFKEPMPLFNKLSLLAAVLAAVIIPK